MYSRKGTQPPDRVHSPSSSRWGPGEHLRRLSGVGVGQIDREAVAVGAVNPPLPGRRVLQSIRHPPEHRVAVLPALLQVDGLQIIHAHQQQEAVPLFGQQRSALPLELVHAKNTGKAVGSAAGGHL